MQNPSQATYQMASKWLKSLGALCAGSMPVAEAEVRVSAYATMLCDRFSIYVFCPKSLQAVAAQSKFFPSYAEVAERLSSWQKDNPPPRHTAIASPDEIEFENWTSSDHQWLKYWRDQRAAGFPKEKSPTIKYPGIFGDKAVDHRKAHVASLIRSKSSRAWDYIESGKA